MTMAQRSSPIGEGRDLARRSVIAGVRHELVEVRLALIENLNGGVNAVNARVRAHGQEPLAEADMRAFRSSASR